MKESSSFFAKMLSGAQSEDGSLRDKSLRRGLGPRSTRPDASTSSAMPPDEKTLLPRRTQNVSLEASNASWGKSNCHALHPVTT